LTWGPGFHGFHVHETGTCEPQSANPSDPAMVGDFLSAGGHLSSEEQAHSDHLGDLSSLLAHKDGTATLTVTTDRLTEQDLLDADGSAVMVHAGSDNFGNIPERYAPAGTDEMTDDTGDSGGRVACAVLPAR
jgi:Cu-Zn family superoxide dismutase